MNALLTYSGAMVLGLLAFATQVTAQPAPDS